MSKSFKGRVVTPGRVKAEALVSHGGFNTLASFQMALFTGNHRLNNRWNGTLCGLCSFKATCLHVVL